ncbi:MAG: caspase family protein [Geminicoccaceae bacterium]|nr:MAG: caspase family protein [Geminicoccaceae bacterium]
MTALDVDPGRTRALLVGNDDFPLDPAELPPLPAVANNLLDLGDVLADPAVFGLPPDRLRRLHNANAAGILTAVAEEAHRAEDTLIIYYAGHGLVHRGQLYLAAADSRQAMIEYTGVDLDKLRSAIRQSPATKRIVVLDCCYSGRAVGEMGGTAGAITAAISDFSGSYVLASAPATAAASAPLGARYTLFTGVLLATLRDGVAGAGATLRLPEVFHAVRRRLLERPGAPEPQQMLTKNLNEAAVFRNRSAAARPTAPALDAAAVDARLAAVEAQNAELRRLIDQLKAEGAAAPTLDRLERQLDQGETALQVERTHGAPAETDGARGATGTTKGAGAPQPAYAASVVRGGLPAWLDLVAFPLGVNVASGSTPDASRSCIRRTQSATPSPSSSGSILIISTVTTGSWW